MKVSGSILSNKYKAKDLANKFNNSTLDYIHLDIMDGKFVKSKTWTFTEVKKILDSNTKKLDVHLMVSNPLKYIREYSLLNAEYITFHYEAVKNHLNIINEIKDMGLKPGLSIKPHTSLEQITSLLPLLDLVLIMSVEPGQSGQTFNSSILYKIEILDKIRKEKKLGFKIEVDGGINDEIAPLLKEKGADILVSASYLHESVLEENINKLR